MVLEAREADSHDVHWAPKGGAGIGHAAGDAGPGVAAASALGRLPAQLPDRLSLPPAKQCPTGLPPHPPAGRQSSGASGGVAGRVELMGGRCLRRRWRCRMVSWRPSRWQSSSPSAGRASCAARRSLTCSRSARGPLPTPPRRPNLACPEWRARGKSKIIDLSR